MTAATSTYRDRPPLRRRATALGLALAIELLLILAFVGLNYRPRPKEFEGGKGIATFDISPAAEQSDRSAAKASPTRPVETVPQPKVALRKVPMPPRDINLPIIPMDRKTLDLADIGKLGSNAPGASEKSGGSAPGDSARVGTAPNGQPLYAAEWYRKPTNAELDAYLPKSMPDEGGSGLIACRTAARYHVEDCIELGSDPPGSHLAGAVRQAAWQFLVRPPRVGGKDLVGEWVRIRIDYLPPQPRP